MVEAAKAEPEAPREEGTRGRGTIITPQPLRSGIDFGDTRSRSSRGQSETELVPQINPELRPWRTTVT